MFEIVSLIVIVAYSIQAIILALGSKKKFEKVKEDYFLSATVIVAARNEEHNILRCLKSLNKLDYPQNKLEIIIVDDNSTDSTNKIITDFIKDKPKFKLIKPAKDFGETKGKARALANAIEIAKGEIILTTDADCSVSETWVKTITSYYKDDVIMVCGFTNQTYTNLFEGVQDTDFIFLLTVGSGSINLGKPLSAIGNNMSYRKSAYDKIGGYKKIPFSVTEDFEVLMAMNKLKDKKILFPADADSLVTSEPCKDIKTLFRQKKRWGIGGLNSRFDNLLIISSGFWAGIVILLSPFFFSVDVFYIILLKILTDFYMLYSMYKRLKLKFNFVNFLGFEIYSTIYFVVIAFAIAINRNVSWKGRKFNATSL
ncbi:MAG: glycosyl transferase [Ignavibacteriae bacterium]|nr:MAG: glycosyl transferase [Ignavibacteriota bacterium]